MPKFVDIHSHLNFPEYDADRDAVILRMKDAGVWTITVGTNLETSRSAVALAERDPSAGIFACIGVHPVDDPAVVWDEKMTQEFETLARHPRVVAIGECGLDYFRLDKDPAVAEVQKQGQRDIFLKQIDLTLAVDKPLMIHCREAYADVYDIVAARKREPGGEKLRGNMHFYAGDLATAVKYIDLGFTLSFTGVVTFTRDYDDVIRAVPTDSIMSETDAPFVAPVPYRGKRNEPAFVPEVVTKLAEIRAVDTEEMRATLVHNALQNFKLSL